MPDRIEKHARKTLNRRVAVSMPIRKVDLIPTPVVTQAITRPQIQRKSNVGQNARELGNALTSFGKALGSFLGGKGGGGSKGGGGKKGGCGSGGSCGTGKVSSPEQLAKKQAAADAVEADADANLFDTGTETVDSPAHLLRSGDVVTNSKVDTAAAIQAMRVSDEEFGGLVEGDVELNLPVEDEDGSFIDTVSLAQTEQTAKETIQNLFDRTEEVRKTAKVPFEDPALSLMAEGLDSQDTLQGATRVTEMNIQALTDPNTEVQDVLDPYLSRVQGIANDMSNQSNRIKFKYQALTAKKQLEQQATKRIIALRNQSNLDTIQSKVSKQLDDYFEANTTTPKLSQGMDKFLKENVAGTINQVRDAHLAEKAGYKTANEYYLKEILTPVVEDRLMEEPEEVLNLIESVQGLPLNKTGATFGTAGAARNKFDEWRNRAEELLNTDPAEANIKRRISETKKIENLFNNAIQNGEDTEQVIQNVRQMYQADPLAPTYIRHAESLKNNYRDAQDTDQGDVVKEQIGDLLVTNDTQEAKDLVDTGLRNGQLTTQQALSFKNHIDKDIINKKARQSFGFNTFQEKFKKLVEEDMFDNHQDISPHIRAQVIAEVCTSCDKPFRRATKNLTNQYFERFQESGLPAEEFFLDEETEEQIVNQAFQQTKDQFSEQLQPTIQKRILERERESIELTTEALRGADDDAEEGLSFWDKFYRFFMITRDVADR